jgi:hypothetical protein
MRPYTEYELLTASRRADHSIADDQTGLNVFVPGLMGAGILLSAGILVSDGIKKLFPNSGARRSIEVTRGVQRTVADTAAAAGIAIEERNISRRRLRSVGFYAIGAVALGVIAVASVSLGIRAYGDDGVLEDNAIAIVFGSVAGAITAGLAISFALLASVRKRRIAGITPVMETTSLGRLQPPPESRLERARLLIPEFSEGNRYE